MLRTKISVALLLLALVGLDRPGQAQLPLTRQQKLRQLMLQRQMKCLKRCEDKGYRRFYRCGPKGSSYCKSKAGVYFRACVRGCKSPQFCKGFRRVVAPKCTKMCLHNRKKTMPRKRWRRRPSRRQYRRWVRRFLRWQNRTRYACLKVCANYSHVCNVRASVKLPPKTQIPVFKNLRWGS